MDIEASACVLSSRYAMLCYDKYINDIYMYTYILDAIRNVVDNLYRLVLLVAGK